MKRVADQLGIGTESLRGWVKQHEIDAGVKPGTTSTEAARIKDLEQEVRELRRANAILKSGGCRTNVDCPARVSRGAGQCRVWHPTSCRWIASS